MATVNFYLNPADKQGKCFILMTYLANGQKFRHSIKMKVYPGQWQATRQRLKIKGMEDEFVNGHLDSLEQIITTAQKESLLTNNEINFNFVKRKFNEALGKQESRKMTFVECFDDYIEDSRIRRNHKTTDRYITCLNHLKKFRTAKHYELTFERINQQFYDSFVNYMMTTNQSLNNTIGNYIKTIKSFTNYCIDKGYCQPNNDVKKFEVFKEDGELVYLTEEELFKIINLELKTERLQIVRDNFCFACFTGLRYSDVSKLKAENLKDDYLEIKTVKTRDFLRIPLNHHAKNLIIRNGGMLPRLFTNQKMNVYLKEIAELANINENVLITKYRGLDKVEFFKPKYEFITSHTARRTFVTLSLEKGMRPETVMSITGHKDYKTFKKYIKLTDKVKLAEMNNIWSVTLPTA